MNLTCLAASGCWVSNDDAAAPNTCFKLDPGASVSAALRFIGESPLHGLSVVFLPPGQAGLMLTSDMVCNPGTQQPTCVDGVMPMPARIGAGNALVTYVETSNHTAKPRARHRREFFVTALTLGSDTGIVSGTTSCEAQLTPQQRAQALQASSNAAAVPCKRVAARGVCSEVRRHTVAM